MDRPTDREELEMIHSDAWKDWTGVRPRQDLSELTDEELRVEIRSIRRFELEERERVLTARKAWNAAEAARIRQEALDAIIPTEGPGWTFTPAGER